MSIEKDRAFDDIDSYDIYSEEVDSYPLLSESEEKKIDQSIIAFRKIVRSPRSDGFSEEKYEIIKRGLGAYNLLIVSNLRIPLEQALKNQGKGVELPDLIEAGNVGLIRATGKYDPSKGYKFDTYATWWVKREIGREIEDHSRQIRHPGHLNQKLQHMCKAHSMLTQELGRQPNSKELAERLGVSEKDVWDKIGWIRQEPISIETPMGGDKTNTQYPTNTLTAEGTIAGPDNTEENVLQKIFVEECLSELNPRQRQVMELRYRLDELDKSRILSLRATAKELNLSTKNVITIEKNAKKALRSWVSLE